VVGVAVEDVGPHHQGGAVLDEQIVLSGLPESVARDGDTPTTFEVNVRLDVAEDIAGDRHMAQLWLFNVPNRLRAAKDANVGRFWGVGGVLDRATSNGDFRAAIAVFSAIDEDVRGDRA